MKVKKHPGKKKIFLSVLISLLVLFGVYAGIDQIVFQNRKADDIAAAKQFVMDNAAVNNITKQQTEMSTDDIISSQKNKIKQFVQKYPTRPEFDPWSLYVQKLEERLADGWKWHEVKISDLQEVSAWKSPFEAGSHIVLSYTMTISCDSGGVVFVEDSSDVCEEELSTDHTIREYMCNEYLVSGSSVRAISTQSSNQPDFLNPSQSH